MITTVKFRFLQYIVMLTLLAFMTAGCGHLNRNNEFAPGADAVTSDSTLAVKSNGINSLPTDENERADANKSTSPIPQPVAPKENAPHTTALVKTSSASPDYMNSLPADESKNEAILSTVAAEPANKKAPISQDDIDSLSTDENSMMQTIEKLTRTIRPIGSQEEKAACADLKSKLESYGYQTRIQEFPYIVQNVKLKNTPFVEGKFWDFNIGQPDGTSQNLIAVKKPAIPDAKDVIIVSAHYDTTVHTTGAIDNASGVAVLMEVARKTANFPSNVEVRFLLFGGEENYLYGSRYYVNSLSGDERRCIIAAINLDCIGEEGPNPATLGTSNGKENAACKLFADYDMQIDRGGMSDYYSFVKAEIPALTIAQYPVMVGTGQELPDDIARIDKAKLKTAADIVAKVLLNTMCREK
ncbi:Peptidase family M28 [Desulfotomaculum arcticum]|uniref:Peptidase family M28 n=1 Tax=Desulfotruncus arcticus DSM 17038 TaxID=1121424 RepID=A0A1I2Z3D3_9FIRM|nr:M28 family peptidase [Desulfotruncus arcticus]SFH31531.1 Peptidase family M28 [Desulfotomaculum arcticum] [Desulfotruncus arcticus DSM 17038]